MSKAVECRLIYWIKWDYYIGFWFYCLYLLSWQHIPWTPSSARSRVLCIFTKINLSASDLRLCEVELPRTDGQNAATCSSRDFPLPTLWVFIKKIDLTKHCVSTVHPKLFHGKPQHKESFITSKETEVCIFLMMHSWVEALCLIWQGYNNYQMNDEKKKKHWWECFQKGENSL